MTIEKIRQIYM